MLQGAECSVHSPREEIQQVVNATVLTTDFSALESTSLATLNVGEVLELIGDEPTTTEAQQSILSHRWLRRLAFIEYAQGA